MFDGYPVEATDCAETGHVQGRRVEPAVGAIGRSAEDDRGRVTRGHEATPFPSEVVSPPPSAPVVVVVDRNARESGVVASQGQPSFPNHARHDIPGDPTVSERHTRFEVESPRAMVGGQVQCELCGWQAHRCGGDTARVVDGNGDRFGRDARHSEVGVGIAAHHGIAEPPEVVLVKQGGADHSGLGVVRGPVEGDVHETRKAELRFEDIQM